jgi:hypothetical protein
MADGYELQARTVEPSETVKHVQGTAVDAASGFKPEHETVIADDGTATHSPRTELNDRHRVQQALRELLDQPRRARHAGRRVTVPGVIVKTCG